MTLYATPYTERVVFFGLSEYVVLVNDTLIFTSLDFREACLCIKKIIEKNIYVSCLIGLFQSSCSKNSFRICRMKYKGPRKREFVQILNFKNIKSIDAMLHYDAKIIFYDISSK